MFFGFATYFDLLFNALSGVVSLCNELKDILGALAQDPRRVDVGVVLRAASEIAEDIRLEDVIDDLPLDIDEDTFEARLDVRWREANVVFREDLNADDFGGLEGRDGPDTDRGVGALGVDELTRGVGRFAFPVGAFLGVEVEVDVAAEAARFFATIGVDGPAWPDTDKLE